MSRPLFSFPPSPVSTFLLDYASAAYVVVVVAVVFSYVVPFHCAQKSSVRQSERKIVYEAIKYNAKMAEKSRRKEDRMRERGNEFVRGEEMEIECYSERLGDQIPSRLVENSSHLCGHFETSDIHCLGQKTILLFLYFYYRC